MRIELTKWAVSSTGVQNSEQAETEKKPDMKLNGVSTAEKESKQS